MILSFLFFLALFSGIGLLSSVFQKNTTSDYLLAGKNVSPWLVGLSAVATYCSGYMFVGQIGYTYTFGLSSVWAMVGYIAGDFLISMLVHHRIRNAVNNADNLTYLSAFEHMAGKLLPVYRKVGGVLITLFLCGYAAAQFSAGSKALFVLFGWPYTMGAIIGAVMVLAYCWAGGIRASIWTDAAQAVVMLVSMSLLAFKGIGLLGGVEPFWHALHQVSPHYMDWFRPATHAFGPMGPWMFALGWFVAGTAVVGQPQVMTRFMTLADTAETLEKGAAVSNMVKARLWYYVFYAIFYVLTLVVGLAARLWLTDAGAFDAELALPMLAQEMLSPVWVGLILAGLFAATMSTADSQILCCTACITEDTKITERPSYLLTKGVTVAVTALALAIALNANDNVFDLVLLSAGTMASLFAPLVMMLCVKVSLAKTRPHWSIPINQPIAFAMMIVAGIVHLYFRFNVSDALCYEILPGIASGVITYGVCWAYWWVKRSTKSLQAK